MKKVIAIALAVVTVISCSAVAFAESQTTLTTTVPDASYTLNIPSDQEIQYGEPLSTLEEITVTEAAGFSAAKNLKVTATCDDFKAEGVNSTIPYTLFMSSASGSGSGTSTVTLSQGEAAYFFGKSDGSVETYAKANEADANGLEYTFVGINDDDWGKAAAGTYTSVITFTTEVVIEE